jgi:putative transposase
MADIMVVLGCLSQCLDPTTLRQLCCVSEAMVSMSGRVTMRGISRWTNTGGSYRTLQRFFYTPMNWLTLQWVLIRHHLLAAGDTILAAGDHVVVTKAGKKTYGLDRFFSSLYGKAVPGLCFLSLSLLSVKRRTSYPALTEQVAKAPVTHKPPHKTSTGSRGRPKGSKNRNRRDVELSPSLRFIQGHLAQLLEQIGDHLKGVYFLFDGELGHNDALQMVRQLGLHLVSKLRYNSALYLPYEGP